jgi:long-chain acyl-CoA synthetase
LLALAPLLSHATARPRHAGTSSESQAQQGRQAAGAAFAARHGITSPAPAVLADHPAVRAAVGAAVDAANTRLSRVEQIKRFAILPTFWEPGGDEITPTMKVKRRPITAKYADVIESLYAAAGEPA